MGLFSMSVLFCFLPSIKAICLCSNFGLKIHCSGPRDHAIFLKTLPCKDTVTTLVIWPSLDFQGCRNQIWKGIFSRLATVVLDNQNLCSCFCGQNLKIEACACPSVVTSLTSSPAFSEEKSSLEKDIGCLSMLRSQEQKSQECLATLASLQITSQQLSSKLGEVRDALALEKQLHQTTHNRSQSQCTIEKIEMEKVCANSLRSSQEACQNRLTLSQNESRRLCEERVGILQQKLLLAEMCSTEKEELRMKHESILITEVGKEQSSCQRQLASQDQRCSDRLKEHNSKYENQSTLLEGKELLISTLESTLASIKRTNQDLLTEFEQACRSEKLKLNQAFSSKFSILEASLQECRDILYKSNHVSPASNVTQIEDEPASFLEISNRNQSFDWILKSYLLKKFMDNTTEIVNCQECNLDHPQVDLFKQYLSCLKIEEKIVEAFHQNSFCSWPWYITAIICLGAIFFSRALEWLFRWAYKAYKNRRSFQRLGEDIPLENIQPAPAPQDEIAQPAVAEQAF